MRRSKVQCDKGGPWMIKYIQNGPRSPPSTTRRRAGWARSTSAPSTTPITPEPRTKDLRSGSSMWGRRQSCKETRSMLICVNINDCILRSLCQIVCNVSSFTILNSCAGVEIKTRTRTSWQCISRLLWRGHHRQWRKIWIFLQEGSGVWRTITRSWWIFQKLRIPGFGTNFS